MGHQVDKPYSLKSQSNNGGFSQKQKKNSQLTMGFYQFEGEKKQTMTQLKTSVIQMRKVNPISKTTNNNSQHTSVEKHKTSNSIGTSI
jgi:hypothetical protein